MDINKNYIIEKPDNFKLDHIFDCGQAFRWEKNKDGSYTGVAFSKLLRIKEKDNKIFFMNSSEEDFHNIWENYFDLNTSYRDIKEQIAIDETMKKAIEFGHGIRILKQDLFETIITFIISANNRIPQIKKSVKLICENYGEEIEEGYFSFPRAEVLAGVDSIELKEIARVGFRNDRIVKTSKMISEGFLDQIKDDMETDEIETILEKLPGVGKKVASCISLFALGRSDSFPVDVWIKRVMEKLYFKKEVPKKEIAKMARNIFGKNCGYAQQYLFYYGRENSIGK